MNVGLEQPIANWSRRAVSLPGVVGKRFSRLPSRPEAIARYRGPGSYYRSIYRTIALPGAGDLRSPLQARVLCFSHPPPLRLIPRPHCHFGIYRWQRSQGQRHSPNASDSGLRKEV